MSLILALLLLGLIVPLLQAAQTVAIQKTKQTFYSYIPLAQGCNYNSSEGISSGEVYYQTVDPLSIFQSIQLTGELAFWGAIQYGLDMYLLTDQLLENGTYSQVVLFNSSINQKFTERQLILTDISALGEIKMYFAIPVYHQPNELTAQIVSNWTSSFPLPVRQQLIECGSHTLIIYLGDFLYLGACPNTTTFIVWNISNSSQSKVYTDIAFLNGSTIEGVTPNPDNLLPIPDINNPQYWKIGGSSYDWNVAVLLDQQSTTIFCMFNLSLVTCEGYQNEALWIQIVANRAWGLQAVIQQTQIEMVISQFPEIVNLTFPGNVISVFTNGLTIFVESVENDEVYLLIYETNQQLANISLPGLIIYYGQERLMLQTSNGTFLIANFVLPMLSIVNNNTQSTANFSIECTETTYNFNFDIFWTNINYPSSLVIQLDQQQIVSYQKVITFDLQNMYQVIGPAFDVFISSDSPLQITLLDTSFVVITESLAAILDIIYVKSTIKYSIPNYLLYITTIGQIKKYILKNGKTQSVINNPCGFQQVSSAKKVYGGYLIMQDSQSCLCTSNFTICEMLTLSDTVGIISSGSVTMAAYLQKMAQIQLNSNKMSSNSPFNKTSIIKEQFLNLLAQNMIVTIYTNNTVVLTTIQGVYLDSVQSSCSIENTTLGLAFTRNFYDDYFFIYCEFSSTISQYYIRKQQLIFNKVIPLYGFLTLGSDGNAAAGTDYIFIEVKLDPQYTGSDAFAKEVESCCILRINPMAFTVSAIAEVILANELVFVQSVLGVDVVYYNQTNVNSEQTYLKVYYDSGWISFSQPGPCSGSQCTPITYNYQIAFNSLFYNFAACYQSTIMYNIQSSLLRTNDPQLEDIQLLQGNGPNIYYTAAVDFNFNSICGPIAYFGQISTLVTDLSIFSIATNEIITPSKFLGNSSSPLLQIIDMGECLTGTALGDLIMIVNEQSLSFYLKYTGVWLEFVEEISDILQPDCMYYLYEIVDNNTAKFGTDCFNADIFTPLLTVTYDPTLNDSLNCTFQKMELPQELRNVQSIVQQDLILPLVFGIGEGPSKSVSGILFYCYAVCTTLVISTKVVFFVDYDVMPISNGEFIVVGLDLEKFSFWISPSIPNGTISSIPANFTVNYSQILGLSCNKIVIVAGSSTSVNVIMGCSGSYVQTEVYMQTGIIEIMNTFNKYANCEQINKFKPTYWINPESKKLEVLVAQCQQNLDTVRLQQFESINSSQSSIVTAYMQIYTNSGPKCGQQWWPIRILPIATSMNFMLFQLYYANNQLKLLYQQIDGTLIDSFIVPTPSATYELIELSRHLVFPTVQLRIGNAYSQLIFMIETNPVKEESPAGIRYSLYIAFAITNFITLIFLICWIIFARKYRRTSNNKSSYQLKKMVETGKQSPRPFNPSSLSASHSASQSESSASSVRHPSNIRKVTEIQLFQPRYKA